MFHPIKSKSDNKARLKEGCSTAVSGLQTTLRIVEQATGTGLPRLQTGIGGLLFVLDVIKTTSQNAEDIEKLSEQIEGLNRVLENSRNGGTFSGAIDRIDRLFSTSNTALEQLQKMASRNLMKRLIVHAKDAQSISNHIQTISWSIESFTIETTLAIEFALDGHATRIREDIRKLDQNTTIGHQNIMTRLDVKDGRPPYATFAAFNSKDRARCLEGTRVDILDQIVRWINFDNSSSQVGHKVKGKSPMPEAPAANNCIFWINGSAGTGKTTIANTVAEACKEHGILGASFFCSRDDTECSNPRLIFTTIAYQLGNFSDSFRAEVTRVINSTPDIVNANPSHQLEELIVKPLRILGTSFSPCLVVMDALDECKETGTTSAILSSLALHIDELFPLKFLVTSRPESRITTIFQSSNLNPVTQRYVLHEVELGVVQSDIKRYLSSKLASTRKFYCINDDWPSEADIHSLALLSSGLFIYAFTSVLFIEDNCYSDPKGQLTRLLSNATPGTERLSLDCRLDQLYSQVLNDALPTISPRLSGRLKRILGTIVFLRDPLSSLVIERLLGVQPGTVQETLRHLHSIIMVPDDNSQVVRTLHPSFFDFIASPARCRNPKFVVNPEIQHTLLAHACLDVMKGLKRDMCRIRNPSMLNNEVDNLPVRIMTCIPPELQYACRHWAWHLSNAMLSDSLVELLKGFCSKYLLYWIEALSLMGDLRNGLLALNAVQQAIAKTSKDVTDMKNLLRDCERFTLEFFPAISTCSLQIYHSVLLFTPEEALIKKMFRPELDIPIRVYNGLDDRWNSCIRTIEGHSGWVLSVACSRDCTRIVSGSDDTTVRLWDAISGAHLNTFKESPSSVYSVALSPDCTRIVSGSDDDTLQVWDAVSGEHLNTFIGHSDSVTSVAFSPHGIRIVSGSDDTTVRLWDAVSGAHLNTFKGHSHSVNSVVFSPDDTRVVSGSSDKTVRLWNAVSGAHLNTFNGHSNRVTSVAFSPHGTRIVSGSDDTTVRLWDAVSGAHLKTFKGHSDSVNSVAFSPDGTRVVSGSYDKTIWLWDAVSGAHLNTFKGHSRTVSSVTFSPDGTRVVSGSHDGTVRLWDAVNCTRAHLKNFKGKPGWIHSLAFSTHGTRILSGFSNNTFRPWDALSGVHLNAFKGHSGSVYSLELSLDGSRIVSGSADYTVRLWDARSGAHLLTFKGHSDTVYSVTFSPDGTRVVSGSSDNTVRLWDAARGALLKTFKGHPSPIYSVSFSPNGTRILSGCSNTTVWLWDAVSGAHLNTLKGHSDSVESVAFSPDGMRIVSGSRDQTVRLWDAVSGAHLNTFKGHSLSVTSVAFSPDGTCIVSGSTDNTVQLWDAINGAHLKTLEEHYVNVKSIAESCSFSGKSLSTNDPNPSSPIFGYISRDGWVHSLTRNRRICWVPVSLRPLSLAANRARGVFGTKDGRVIILDFTGVDSYFRYL